MRLIACNHLRSLMAPEIINVPLSTVTALAISNANLVLIVLSLESHETYANIYSYRKMLDSLTTLMSHSYLCYKYVHFMGKKIHYFFHLWQTIHKRMYSGSVAEVSMFLGENREKYVSVNTAQGWTHNETADNLLHCWETPEEQHDGLVKTHKRHSF